MAKTRIKFDLSEAGINAAIKEIEEFKQRFLRKVDTYRKRVTEELANDATLNFSTSVMDDVVNGSPRSPDVTVTVDERGSISVVVAHGEDAVWCEFGSGVYHNGPVGSSPSPYGSALGFTIGSYGEGRGRYNSWGYYDENGELVITRGTKASMPMYNAAQAVTKKAIDIAKEVFG